MTNFYWIRFRRLFGEMGLDKCYFLFLVCFSLWVFYFYKHITTFCVLTLDLYLQIMF